MPINSKCHPRTMSIHSPADDFLQLTCIIKPGEGEDGHALFNIFVGGAVLIAIAALVTVSLLHVIFRCGRHMLISSYTVFAMLLGVHTVVAITIHPIAAFIPALLCAVVVCVIRRRKHRIAFSAANLKVGGSLWLQCNSHAMNPRPSPAPSMTSSITPLRHVGASATVSGRHSINLNVVYVACVRRPDLTVDTCFLDCPLPSSSAKPGCGVGHQNYALDHLLVPADGCGAVLLERRGGHRNPWILCCARNSFRSRWYFLPCR